MADAKVIEVFPHQGFQDLVRDCVGAAVDELFLHLCVRHHGCRKRDPVNPLLKLQGIFDPDGTDHVEDLRSRLDNVRRISAGIRDRVVDPGSVRHVLS